MTSNVGSQIITELTGTDEESSIREQVLERLRQKFLPEFLNRIDEIIVFEPLDRHDIRKIVDLQLTKLEKQMASHGYTLEVSESVRTLLANEGFDPIYGARPLRRVIQNRLQNALANALLGGEFTEGATIVVNQQNGELTFDAQ
jgi:ATP-dependent Clp protease ATP-binding subunit ClpB